MTGQAAAAASPSNPPIRLARTSSPARPATALTWCGRRELTGYRLAEDFAQAHSGLDVVLDTVGGDTQLKSFGAA
jgi:hypothetical protein